MNESQAPNSIATKCRLEEKLAYLRRADAYPDKPDRVDTIETHFAWVFLSKHYVYKLKKPISFHGIDFTTLEKRHRNCDLEVSLNRRLAKDIYIAVVPLGRMGGRLRLEHDEKVVEWLVKMRRLPDATMLDRLAIERRVGTRELNALLEKLAGFYERTARAPWSGPEYVASLTDQISSFGGHIAAVADGIDLSRLNRLVSGQLEFVASHAPLLEQRIAAGRVVDAHGDLRPEHIYLGAEPQIIDCLEFSATLRLLDTAEEISFLDLECERLGRPELGRKLRVLYRRHCRDSIGTALYRFYRSRRGLARALVSAWHLHEGLDPAAEEHWTERSNWYLDAAWADVQTAIR